jgi:hypothetical protein
MNNSVVYDRSLIAPCGINCGTCIAYLREKNKCCGCWPDGHKTNHCYSCSIKNCDKLANTDSKLCNECEIFPCVRIKHIDKRYSLKYKTSLIGNLKAISESGLPDFLIKEAEKWRCSKCGSALSVHRDTCLVCGERRTPEV